MKVIPIQLDDLFECREIHVKEKGKKEAEEGSNLDEKKTGVWLTNLLHLYKLFNIVFQVFCTDCEILIDRVISDRNLDPEKCDIHFGFDEGQGSLKLGFTITEHDETDEKTSKKVMKKYDIFYLLQKYLAKN